MNSEGRDISITTFAFAQGLGGFMASLPTAIILCVSHGLSWSLIWSAIANSIIITSILGIVIGCSKSLFLYSKASAIIMTILMLALTLGMGVWIAYLTIMQYDGAFIWAWFY